MHKPAFPVHPSLVNSSWCTDTLASRSSVLPLTGGLGQAGQSERHLSTNSTYSLLHCTTSPSAQRDAEPGGRSIMQWKWGRCNHQACPVAYLSCLLNRVLFVCSCYDDGHAWILIFYTFSQPFCNLVAILIEYGFFFFLFFFLARSIFEHLLVIKVILNYEAH